MSDRMTNPRQRRAPVIRWRRRLTALGRALGYGPRVCGYCGGRGRGYLTGITCFERDHSHPGGRAPLVTCPACNGTGRIDLGANCGFAYCTCPHCNGTRRR